MFSFHTSLCLTMIFVLQTLFKVELQKLERESMLWLCCIETRYVKTHLYRNTSKQQTLSVRTASVSAENETQASVITCSFCRQSKLPFFFFKSTLIRRHFRNTKLWKHSRLFRTRLLKNMWLLCLPIVSYNKIHLRSTTNEVLNF